MVSPTCRGSSFLALGTVQFGLPYGVANTQGQVSAEQAETMLAAARTAGIDTLDTAIAYGKAEALLGQIGVSDFRLISKLPALSQEVNSIEDWVLSETEASLTRLRINRLGGLMLHHPDDLLGPNGPALARGLQKVRDMGLVERIGLSVYTPEQLDSLFHLIQLEILQIPANVFDRRFAETGWLKRLVAAGVEVHARSVFLQGLLLLPPDKVPAQFAPFVPLINSWHAWLNHETTPKRPLEACLAHMASYDGISRLVVGADSLKQLQEIILAANSLLPRRAPDSLSSYSPSLINPAQWNKL